MIFVSTCGFRDIDGAKAAKKMINAGIRNIELSGGLYNKKTVSSLIKTSDRANLQIHNYFPPPEIPFVLNLASTNKTTIENLDK